MNGCYAPSRNGKWSSLSSLSILLCSVESKDHCRGLYTAEIEIYILAITALHQFLNLGQSSGTSPSQTNWWPTLLFSQSTIIAYVTFSYQHTLHHVVVFIFDVSHYCNEPPGSEESSSSCTVLYVTRIPIYAYLCARTSDTVTFGE